MSAPTSAPPAGLPSIRWSISRIDSTLPGRAQLPVATQVVVVGSGGGHPNKQVAARTAATVHEMKDFMQDVDCTTRAARSDGRCRSSSRARRRGRHTVAITGLERERRVFLDERGVVRHEARLPAQDATLERED